MSWLISAFANLPEFRSLNVVDLQTNEIKRKNRNEMVQLRADHIIEAIRNSNSHKNYIEIVSDTTHA